MLVRHRALLLGRGLDEFRCSGEVRLSVCTFWRLARPGRDQDWHVLRPGSEQVLLVRDRWPKGGDAHESAGRRGLEE